jgi:hypothetical protein
MEHFSRSTVSQSLWCPKHRRYTMHRIDGVKGGPCEECLAELERQHKLNEAIRRARDLQAKQIDLFPGIL